MIKVMGYVAQSTTVPLKFYMLATMTVYVAIIVINNIFHKISRVASTSAT